MIDSDEMLKVVNPIIWTLEEGVEIARKIEAAIHPKAHCALGGGVLMKGFSKKDLDIYIYPHKERIKVDQILEALKIIFPEAKWIEPESEYIPKTLVMMEQHGKRIDFFFFTESPEKKRHD